MAEGPLAFVFASIVLLAALLVRTHACGLSVCVVLMSACMCVHAYVVWSPSVQKGSCTYFRAARLS